MLTAFVQKLVDARLRRDKVITRERGDLVEFAYRIVSAQSTVDQAKKQLYMQMRSEGSTIKHKDVAKGPFKEVTGWYTVKEVDGEKIRTWNHRSDG